MSLQDFKSYDFRELDEIVADEFSKTKEFKDFLNDPKDFRALSHVTELLRNAQTNQPIDKISFDQSPIFKGLLKKRDKINSVIEKVVQFDHGGLNLTVDTMGEVVASYTKGRGEIQRLRNALDETKNVLMNKNKAHLKLRDLWLKKTELQESLRIVKNIEFIKVNNIAYYRVHHNNYLILSYPFL